MSTPSDETPLMKQYSELKRQAGDALLFFRMGDFYELFGEDAVEAARILEITLTSRDKNKPNPIPMAGVPHHSAASYIQRLLDAGKKVCIGEQMEDPAAVKGIVRREIVRTFTPAIQFESEGSQLSYLATAVASDNGWTLACLEPSTGETLLGDALTDEALQRTIDSLPIRHWLDVGQSVAPRKGLLIESLPPHTLSLERAQDLLRKQYQMMDLSPLVPSETSALALGLVLLYALKTQKRETWGHIRLPRPIQTSHQLRLGPRTAEHLDLFPSADGTPNLYGLINQTRSAAGARKLRQWLAQPLCSLESIHERQAAVQELAQASHSPRIWSEILGQIYDLERILGRVATRLAHPRDTLALGRTLSLIPAILDLLRSSTAPSLRGILTRLTEVEQNTSSLCQKIIRTQRDDAPLVARDGGIFQRGTHPELDRLIDLNENGARWLIELEARERAATGIGSLKVRYNRVFGYYIEITKTHLKNVPEHYQRKQSMVNAERFFTDELKAFEEESVTASSRQCALEQQLFEELVSEIESATSSILNASDALSELDTLVSLSRWALEPGWVFPTVDASWDLNIELGRHPLVDQSLHGGFVPNSVHFSKDSRELLLITGPNMGGKSTVMRQVALIVLLGQLGAPVPAKEARWGYFTSLYTRIGAHDAIARGQSTFMVEMSELAHILHHANDRSLLILDEIGRGTSTYDGVSVAWATVEYLCTRTRARALFATHYHELTALSESFATLTNVHMAVASKNGKEDFRFLYELKEGAANESFGIQVGKLAGLPSSVIERAWKILAELETGKIPSPPSPQLSLFDPRPGLRVEPEITRPHPIVSRLQEADVNQLTPLQALNLLSELQEQAKQ